MLCGDGVGAAAAAIGAILRRFVGIFLLIMKAKAVNYVCADELLLMLCSRLIFCLMRTVMFVSQISDLLVITYARNLTPACKSLCLTVYINFLLTSY